MILYYRLDVFMIKIKSLTPAVARPDEALDECEDEQDDERRHS